MRNFMKDAIMKSLPNTFKIKKIDVTEESLDKVQLY